MISSNPQNKLSFKERTIQYREQRIFKRKQRFFVILLAWILFISYIFSPLSKANITSLKGNYIILTPQTLYEIGFFSPRSFWWDVNLSQSEDFLNQYPYIKEATIRQKLTGVEITLYEVLVVGRRGNACQVFGDDCYFYLSNGKEVKGQNNGNIYDHRHIQSVTTIPWIKDQESYNENDFSTLLSQLGLIEAPLLRKIKEITINSSYVTFAAVNLIIDATTWGTEQDITITIDIDHLAEKFTTSRVTTLLEELAELGRYRLVCVEGSTCIATE